MLQLRALSLPLVCLTAALAAFTARLLTTPAIANVAPPSVPTSLHNHTALSTA